MSGAANEEPGVDFAESDTHATPLPYGEGRFPWWVILVWVVVLIGLTIYAIVYWVPDFRAW